MKNTTSAKSQSSKTVNIICRIEIKKNASGEAVHGRVVYQVRSSSGIDIYFTTLIDGHATGCTCPSRKPCYHMHQLEAIEEKRVVIKVGEVPVSGVTAQHAVEKALRLVKSRTTIADVDVVAQASQVVEELPLLPEIEEETLDNEPLEENLFECIFCHLEEAAIDGRFCSDECKQAVVEIEAEARDARTLGAIEIHPLDCEEFSEDVAEQWTEQEITAIRAAALPRAPRILPKAHKYENAPLNNNSRDFSNVLLHR